MRGKWAWDIKSVNEIKFDKWENREKIPSHFIILPVPYSISGPQFIALTT